MRQVLECCVRVDELAEMAYRQMQRRCTDPVIADLCGRMANEEASHVVWWQELLEAWDEGLLPDVWSTSEAALTQLRDTITQLEMFTTGPDTPMSAEAALTTAARIEFFALDPIFAELLELAEPGIARARHDAYTGHVNRLIEALETTFSPDSLAGFLATILRRAEVENRQLSRYATHDPLTGLGNRRSLAAQASQWASWAARYGSPVTILLIDVDHFKRVNDAYGHAMGDTVLRAVTGAICTTIRKADLVARYGGDEFVILAPELEPDGARVLGDRIVNAVREVRVEAEGDAYVSVTVSVGIATVFDPPDSQPRDLDTMLAAADRSLYAAKRSGRDRAADPVVMLHELPLD